MLLFFRNDTGFGGNNGFTDFKRILGFPITAPGTRMVLFVITGAALIGFAAARRAAIVTSKLGRVLTAIRDAETRVMFSRLQPAVLQALHLDAVGGDLRHRRRAVRAAGRHHQPERDVAGELDRDRDLGRGRRPRHADRADDRRGASSTARKSWFTQALPEYWLFVLGLLFILVTLFLPHGVAGLWIERRAAMSRTTNSRHGG